MIPITNSLADVLYFLVMVESFLLVNNQNTSLDIWSKR